MFKFKLTSFSSRLVVTFDLGPIVPLRDAQTTLLRVKLIVCYNFVMHSLVCSTRYQLVYDRFYHQNAVSLSWFLYQNFLIDCIGITDCKYAFA